MNRSDRNQGSSERPVVAAEFRTRQLPWRERPLASLTTWLRLMVFRPPLLAGLLLWLSFPPVGWSFLAWFALVPLAVLIRSAWRSAPSSNATRQRSVPVPVHALPIYTPAWIGGLVFGLLAVQWIRYADDSGPTGFYGWWALAFYMSLYFPLFLLIARMAVLRFQVPIIVALPVVWVGLEYLRSWLISGFPWYFICHTQYESLWLIQVADFAGAYGVSFLVAMVNGWIVDLVAVPLWRSTRTGSGLAPQQVWRFALLAAATGGSLAYGRWRLGQETGPPSPRIAVMQSSIPQRVKGDEEQIPAIHRSYWDQLAEVASDRPDLIIWPETAYRYPLPIVEGVSDSELRHLLPDAELDPSEIREFARRVRSNLGAYAERSGVPNLFGINTELFEPGVRRQFNSAYLIGPDGALSEPYHKVHLVPWGEYLPLRDLMPWLRIFTPHASADYGLESGSEWVRFRFDDLTFGVLICFEDTLPWAARAYVQTEPVDFLVNISNDGWFGVVRDGEEEAGLWRRAEHEAHLGISVFRAIETRRPLFRAVNTGVSAMIDSNGRIVRSSAADPDRSELSAQVLVESVPLDPRRSPYSSLGDWLGATAQWLVALIVLCRFGGAAISYRARRSRLAASA